MGGLSHQYFSTEQQENQQRAFPKRQSLLFHCFLSKTLQMLALNRPLVTKLPLLN